MENGDNSVAGNYFPKDICIVGTGKVSLHLIKSLSSHFNLYIVGRNEIKAKKYAGIASNKNIGFGTLNDIPTNFDVYIIAVSDDAIKYVSDLLPTNKIIVHTSGASGLDVLISKHKGVLYPLYTFSERDEIDFRKVPIFIEGSNNMVINILRMIAEVLSPQVYVINSEMRCKLHAAAVISCNFINYLFSISYELMEKSPMEFNLLRELVDKTVEKAFSIRENPILSQTGPAVRNDVLTIRKHLELLDNEHREVYKCLTDKIIEKINK